MCQVNAEQLRLHCCCISSSVTSETRSDETDLTVCDQPRHVVAEKGKRSEYKLLQVENVEQIQLSCAVHEPLVKNTA